MINISKMAEEYIMQRMEDWQLEILSENGNGPLGEQMVKMKSAILIGIVKDAFYDGFQRGEESFYDKQPTEPMTKQEIDSIRVAVTTEVGEILGVKPRTVGVLNDE